MRDVFAVLTVLAVLAGGVGLSSVASRLPAPTLWWGLHASPMRIDAHLRMREHVARGAYYELFGNSRHLASTVTQEAAPCAKDALTKLQRRPKGVKWVTIC
jgi:hypothetical protein